MAQRLFLISHTHWDREWHLPFQVLRLRLVDALDQLLHILHTKPDYAHFTLDGQTILVDDYVEVRPEKRQELASLIEGGRLLVGPWYVQPDEFLVSGEALIRNLMLGHRSALALGRVMKVGYVPDACGHIGQLPQLLRGFGIDAAVIWRGVDHDRSEFHWVAPDGSRVLAIYLPHSYANAASLPLAGGFAQALRQVAADLVPWATTSNLLLMYGFDYMAPQAGLSQRMEEARSELGGEVELIFGTLLDIVATIGAAQPELVTVRGEFRSHRRAPILPGILSSRLWIKQRNDRLQRLLERWAEPFDAWSSSLGMPSLSAPIRIAWRHLLQNHSQNSIGGSSADSVHREMQARFDACEQIGQEVTHRSLTALLEHLPPDTTEDGDAYVIPLSVFNAAPYEQDGEAQAQVEIPTNWLGFRMEDAEGNPIPCEQVEAAVLPTLTETTVRLLARQVPPVGYRFYFLRPAVSPPAEPVVRRVGPDGDRQIENEYYRVEADAATGSLTVTDRLTGRIYPGLHRFVDEGDAGDTYNYSPPRRRDRRVDRPAQPPRITVVEGPIRISLHVQMSYQVPPSLRRDRASRLRRSVALPIMTEVSLLPDVRRIEFHTTIKNTVRDHRLRVHFPLPVRTDRSTAAGGFDVVQRPTDLPGGTQGWLEQPTGTHPQHDFVDVSEGGWGLLLASRGLPEFEVLPGETGITLALTLLRGVGWLSRDDLLTRKGHAGPSLETPDAQCLGRWEADYAVILHKGDWRTAFAEAYRYRHPLRALPAPHLPERAYLSGQFMQVEPASLVISAVKWAEDGDGVILRLFNLASQAVQGRVRLHVPVASAMQVNLNEEALASLPVEGDGSVRLPVNGRQIVTIKFYLPTV